MAKPAALAGADGAGSESAPTKAAVPKPGEPTTPPKDEGAARHDATNRQRERRRKPAAVDDDNMLEAEAQRLNSPACAAIRAGPVE